MNVLFLDKLSATVFHNLLNQPGNDYVQDWLLRFFIGAWCDRATDFSVDLEPRDLVRNQHGSLCQLRLSINACDVFRHPEFPEILLTDEVNWSLWSYKVDDYGLIIPKQDPIRVIVGGLINHGDLEKPSWSSHT